MHLCDMKKITVIASLFILFTACEKADIRPNTPRSSESTESTVETTRAAQLSRPTQAGRSAADPSTNSGGGDAGSLNGASSTAGPGANPDPVGGEITDPIRKKDQKDNK